MNGLEMLDVEIAQDRSVLEFDQAPQHQWGLTSLQVAKGG
jgi:hypothetical protein